jgi:ribonuclease BN (tRNA processing enzyme)
VKLTIVGSASAYTLQPGNASSCYLVEVDGTAILLDIGQGAFAALGAHRDPATLDAIVVSHLHPDHLVDLVPMRHYLRFAQEDPTPVTLHAPGELRQRIDALMGDDDFLAGLPGDDITPGTQRIGRLTVEARPVTHSLNSHAFRISGTDETDAPGLVYSGDVGVAEDLLPLIRRGDVLLCEASWGVASVAPTHALHLTAEEAARVARDGGASRLILTHVLDRFDPAGSADKARNAFDGPVDTARPGMSVEIA